MDLLHELSLSAVFFSQHLTGIVLKPYQTYRSLSLKGRWGELWFIGVFSIFYFALASLVRTASFRPFLLTKEFIVLSAGSAAGYLLVVGTIGLLGKIWKKDYSLKAIALTWGYSLIPTTLWFLTTSCLYVIIPPPRTESIAGISFSFLYLTISTVLFFWKAELYFLTLRFGLHFDLFKIIVATAILLPILFLYSFLMYKFGIFRIPFL